MEDEILAFIEKHNGHVCVPHLQAEFDYVPKKEIDRSIKYLLFSGFIETSSGCVSYNNIQYHFLKIKEA
mgnify:CR=1 FL=1|tara:strand:- start:1915 stop:2121 length:207 start_codon:yes stop_codon:yes gene_type:complete